MKGTIAGHKIDKCASILTEKYSDKIQSLYGQITSIIENAIIEVVDKEVLDFSEKYPKKVNFSNSIYLKVQDETFKGNYFNHKALPVLSEDEKKKVESIVLNKVKSKYNIIVSTKEKKQELGNKIKCTLSKLKSYKKVKENFPEAYKVIVEKIDKEKLPIENENLCDSVEELRAELTSKKQ